MDFVISGKSGVICKFIKVYKDVEECFNVGDVDVVDEVFKEFLGWDMLNCYENMWLLNLEFYIVSK